METPSYQPPPSVSTAAEIEDDSVSKSSSKQTKSQPISHSPKPPSVPSTSATATKTSSSNESQISPSPSATATAASCSNESQNSQEIKDDLFNKVMKEEWNDVISIYRMHKSVVQTAKITRAKETALHVAISNGRKNVVKQLLEIIDPDKIGTMTNDRRENPLHLAAALGQVEICKQIVKKDVELIGTTNKDGETPLFLAALHGKKGAFCALHPTCPLYPSGHLKHDVMHCTRDDKNTILHVAILGEYFELAFHIINWYPELSNLRNKKGQTALHLLAQNPSAFRSGCHFGPLDDFIYQYCLFIDPIKVEMPSDLVDKHQSDITPVPKNYGTCADLLKMLLNAMVHCVSRWKIDNIKDAEKQLLPVQCTSEHQKQDTCGRSHIKIKVDDTAKEASHSNEKKEEEASQDSSTSRPPYPSNYYTFFRFLGFAMELFQFILGLGLVEVRKFKEEKRKHMLAFEVMTKLVRLLAKTDLKYSGSVPATYIEGDNKYLDFHEQPDVTPDEHPQITGKGEKSNGMNEEILERMMELLIPLRSQEKDIKEINKIISEMKRKKIQVEADKTQHGVYNLQLKDIEDDVEERPAFLISAMMGVTEIVEEILNVDPDAINVLDANDKNMLLLAAEHKQSAVLKILLKNARNAFLLKKVDRDGNNALHLAAALGKSQSWHAYGVALQMQCAESSAFLISAMMGVTEIVEEILNVFPVAINDRDANGKNVLLLAAEHKQPAVWNILFENVTNAFLLKKVDKDGNNALHLAATSGKSQSWHAFGVALQMQCEVKWYQFIKDEFHPCGVNYKGETPKEIFIKTHTGMVKEAQKWLTSTSNACSVVVTVIATVAYASVTDFRSGKNNLDMPLRNVFAIFSLVSICTSVASLGMFLSILTSKFEMLDFLYNLPFKLISGLTLLFLSVSAMLVSFSISHFFVVEDQLKMTTFPIYAIVCFPITLFAGALFPLYFSVIRSTFTQPKRRNETTTL